MKSLAASIFAFLAAAGAAMLAQTPPNPSIADVHRAFQRPPDDARIMMRWWWFGSAVTKTELEREMRLMKEGGIGGFEVQPVYPLALDDAAQGFRNLPYLSDEFIDASRFTSEKAKELGMRMDLTLASGWPYGGPHTPIAEAAGRLMVTSVKAAPDTATVRVRALTEGEKFLAAFIGATRLPDPENGVLQLPPGRTATQDVRCFIAGHARMMVKRAAVGAEGYVIDHYSRTAIDHHLKIVGDRLMQAFGDNPPYAVFSDSLEVFASDWTADLPAEFQKRRGYDLIPYLPALVTDIGEKTAAVRGDWGKTLTELANERYLTPVEEWAQAHHTEFRSQTYGTPPVALSSNALVDLPEGEHPYWREFSQTRWAASASHLYGKPVTSSETWTWLHSPVFRATPLDMKAEADLHFLQGINQLIGHGWPYSPPSAGYPGWRFYAAAVFDQDNPWWLAMPDITKYLQRVSYLLRQGKPANDVAIYLPTSDAYAHFTAGKNSVDKSMDDLFGPTLIPQILDAGYNFDYIDDAAIEKVGVPYPVLILPGVERIPLAAYRKIEEYARKGGIVVATRKLPPSAAPGLLEGASDTAKVRELSEALFKERGHLVGDEKTLGEQLHKWLKPDLALSPNVPKVGFVHRKLGNGEAYFIVNTGNQPVHTDMKFRVADLEPQWWDPSTGDTLPQTGSTIDLAPYESRVVVFSKEQANLPKPHPRTAQAEPIDLSSGWKATFTRTGQSLTFEQLHSWADDEKTKFYSGEAVYERTVKVPAVLLRGSVALNFGEGTAVPEAELRNGMRAWLESPIREAAVVYVNDHRVGTLWHPPYELDVTLLLHEGENKIRVVVGNLALNALAGQKLPDYKDLVEKYGNRFQAQDLEDLKPLPAGLLGPVKLLPR